MNLSPAQFAIAAQADPKWVQNAAAILGWRLEYTPESARHLGLVRVLSATLGVPLRVADEMARQALGSRDLKKAVVAQAADGSVHATVDLQRYLSSYTAALSRALVFQPRKRGRPAALGISALEEGRAYGLDVGLYRANLDRSPAERLAELDANMGFMNTVLGRLRK
jgi:hypothetical protein